MIPFYVNNPSVPDHYPKVKVPDEIVRYCDDKVSLSRESLQYLDCIWYHMGYYGNSKKALKEIRNNYSIRPIFD